MYIKKKNKKNFLNITVSAGFVLLFCFVVLNAESYKVQQRTFGVNAKYLEVKNEKDNGNISLGNIIVGEFGNNFTYIVQKGDNLYNIAQRFGTTVDNIKKVNDLDSDVVKEGEELIISQQEGILYELEESVELKNFVNKYNLDIKSIKSINYIYEENKQLEEGSELFVPISKKKAKEKGLIENEENVIVHNNDSEKESNYQSPKNTSSNVISQWYENPQVANGFYPGHCTWYVAYEMFDEIRPWGGNARKWYQNAAANGYKVGQEPKVGAIVVMMFGSGYWRHYGHVAIVEKIDWNERKILVREMNYVDRFVVTRRWTSIDNSIIGYIYY